jgi:hypothetical protein
LAYGAPSDRSAENDRSALYLMSLVVIGEPSSYFRPSFSVKVQVLKSGDFSHLSARSPTSSTFLVSPSHLNAVSVR